MKKLLLITLLTVVSSAPALAQSNAGRVVLKLNKEYEEASARRVMPGVRRKGKDVLIKVHLEVGHDNTCQVCIGI